LNFKRLFIGELVVTAFAILLPLSADGQTVSSQMLAYVQEAIQTQRPQSEWTHVILKNREGGRKPHGITFEVTSNEGNERQNQAFVDSYTGQLQGLWDYDPYNR